MPVSGGKTYHIVSVVFVHLLNGCVNQGLQAVSLALNDKLSLSLQGCYGQKDVFDKGQDTVFLDNLGGGDSLADLLGDGVWGVQQIDFAFYIRVSGQILWMNLWRGGEWLLPSSLELILEPLRPGTMGFIRCAR